MKTDHMPLRELLAFAQRNGAAEVHLKANGPIAILVKGVLRNLPFPKLGPADVEAIVREEMRPAGEGASRFVVDGFGTIDAYLKAGEARLVLPPTR